MHSRSIVAGLLILLLSASAWAELAIEQEQPLVPASELPPLRGNRLQIARLAPQGRAFLYVRGAQDGTRSLLLRDLESGREAPVPVTDPAETGGLLTRFSFFSSDGSRLLVADMKRAQDGRRTAEVFIYDIASGKITPVALDAGMPIAHFLPDGRSVVVSLMGGGTPEQLVNLQLDLQTQERRTLNLPGWLQSVSPTQLLATVHARPERPRAATGPSTAPSSNPPAQSERRAHFLLWDIGHDRQVTELPTHPHNSALDDVQAVWSRDGRYVAYIDRSDDPEERNTLTRIWDTRSSEPAAAIPSTLPLGPGPGGGDFILASSATDAQQILHYDPQTQQRSTLSAAGKRPVHAHGDRILYMSDINGTPTLCVARLVEK
jgi:hypothetical protein